MKLKSYGCSFIFGSDLADIKESPATIPSLHTWPAKLAHYLGLEYECLAWPGIGNLQIAEQVLSNTGTDKDLVIIGWTWIDRFDYTNTNIFEDPFNKRVSNWNTILPGDIDETASFYYKKLHSEYRDKLCSLMHIRLIIDFLEQKNIPFFMTYMDDLLFDKRWNHTPAVLELQNSVKPHMHDFEGQTFLEWSRKNNFAISDKWHPLEQAHDAAFEYMIKFFDKQKTVGPVQLVRV